MFDDFDTQVQSDELIPEEYVRAILTDEYSTHSPYFDDYYRYFEEE